MFLIEPVNISESEERITTIGWERNKKNQLHPRIVDMSSSMNTEKLAESAVNLNLKVFKVPIRKFKISFASKVKISLRIFILNKLMKWRIAPDIDLEVIKNQKCLLLGSGTLGCNVARCLMVN